MEDQVNFAKKCEEWQKMTWKNKSAKTKYQKSLSYRDGAWFIAWSSRN